MKTTSKIIKGRELQDFDISKGSLYIMRNTNVVVMASQENEKMKGFSGVIVSGTSKSGWSIGHYSTVWSKEDFKVFEGTIELDQIN